MLSCGKAVAFLFVLCAVFFPPAAAADTVYMKNGRKMVGKVTEEEEQVIVENDLGVMIIPRKNVERIEKDEKTLVVPKESKDVQKKVSRERPWEVLPDMPLHQVAFAQVETGARLVAYSPREGAAISGRVKQVTVLEEDRRVEFEAPAAVTFSGREAQEFVFFKIDTEDTLAKLLFFGCEKGDAIDISTEETKNREVSFVDVAGANVTVRETGKAPETIPAKSVYMVVNRSASTRVLESYLKSKGLEIGDCVALAQDDGALRTGKLTRKEVDMAMDSWMGQEKIDWDLAQKLTEISSSEYEARMKRLRTSRAAYSPAVSPGDNVRSATAAYGTADVEGEGITGKVGVEGAATLGLYTRFFTRAGLWVSSRKDTIYEIETGKGFEGKIYGIPAGLAFKEIPEATDLYFYRSNVNNPRVLTSDALLPLQVEILLDANMEKVEKVRVTDITLVGDWTVRGGVIMRRSEGR